ncbi:bestrophin family ion channel [uncultured Paludibaculum sp.]|uniref:bestrophin family protein n=1 Tax=uncultured Paludibaculum sp. TaxID=1765020 RepID=UPI002AAADA9C|nr:bestrophin family ion channel [uncultured Paludibaculum sp.]
MIHYDPHKWLDHFFDLRGSLVKEIGLRVLVCVVWAAAVVSFHKFVRPVDIPSILHSLVGVALGLLLVFRTNASYDRYWEGRKLWGGIVNETRNLIRASAVHLHEEPRLLQKLARWTALFPWATMNCLRDEFDLGSLGAELTAEEVSGIRASQHQALHVSARMSELLAEMRSRGLVSDIVYTSLDQNVQLLVDYLGGCERIRKTPLPFAYIVHLRRALVIYCFTLPFALVDTFGWMSLLDVLLISYTFFGIEEIGVEIEGPFGDDANDLPMRDICETIHKNLYALAGMRRQEREAMPEGL